MAKKEKINIEKVNLEYLFGSNIEEIEDKRIQLRKTNDLINLVIIIAIMVSYLTKVQFGAYVLLGTTILEFVTLIYIVIAKLKIKKEIKALLLPYWRGEVKNGKAQFKVVISHEVISNIVIVMVIFNLLISLYQSISVMN
ncbi:hypothetical protein V074_02721 [Staphylococcus aureus 2010-60-1240-1]|uniref:hypothetical protein n=1 Tax=Staphylococcaceae TaxID=90964 RepID=UPI00045181B4|nr:hypothetical protein [Staphylococcus aureus]EZV56800.1 hypothetical protein V074_02721 [Staphylococcus aureus 2010-60-1240-1]MBZ5280810.1 hypothetical protein [Staphylococcus aureus]MDG6736497.1 hypothetical protein [Staphylococcus aureus]HDE6300845.1 hypothetical protein [Staphylococcus aureus]HDG4682621.1 hypothetical protein [Staphylococcus aureus]